MTTTPTDEYQPPTQKVKTIDSGEPTIGWTVQAPTMPVPLADTNPVTLKLEELPIPAEATAMGVDADTYMTYFTNVEGAEVVDGTLVHADSGTPVVEAPAAPAAPAPADTTPAASV